MTLTRLTRLDYWCVLQLLMISPIVPQVWPNLGQCLDQYSIIYHKLHQFNNTYQYNNNHGYKTSERILFYLWRFHVLVPVKKMCITSPFLKKKKEKKTMLLTTRFFFSFPNMPCPWRSSCSTYGITYFISTLKMNNTFEYMDNFPVYLNELFRNW